MNNAWFYLQLVMIIYASYYTLATYASYYTLATQAIIVWHPINLEQAHFYKKSCFES